MRFRTRTCSASGGGEVHGTKWFDANRNQAFDIGEGETGATIFVDLDRDGLHDDDEPYCVTDENGGDPIPGLPAGEHRVTEVDPGREFYRPESVLRFPELEAERGMGSGWIRVIPRSTGFALHALGNSIVVGDPGADNRVKCEGPPVLPIPVDTVFEVGGVDIGFARRLDATTGRVLNDIWNPVINFENTYANTDLRWQSEFGSSVMLQGSRLWVVWRDVQLQWSLDASWSAPSWCSGSAVCMRRSGLRTLANDSDRLWLGRLMLDKAGVSCWRVHRATAEV